MEHVLVPLHRFLGSRSQVTKRIADVVPVEFKNREIGRAHFLSGDGFKSDHFFVAYHTADAEALDADHADGRYEPILVPSDDPDYEFEIKKIILHA